MAEEKQTPVQPLPEQNSGLPITEEVIIPKPASSIENDLLNIKKTQAGSPTYSPTRFVEQFYFQDNGAFWVNINNLWKVSHWEYISTATGNNVSVPAGTNFIIVESDTALPSDNVPAHGVVIISRNKLTATLTSRGTANGAEVVSYTATWDLNAGTVTTGHNGTFHFYT